MKIRLNPFALWVTTLAYVLIAVNRETDQRLRAISEHPVRASNDLSFLVSFPQVGPSPVSFFVSFHENSLQVRIFPF